MALEELNPITEKIIGCAFKVGSTLGVGFLEKVYENALVHELSKIGLKVEQQKPITVYYDGVEVGHFDADLFVEDKVLVELNVAKAFDEMHMAQCLNYLKATGLPLCLLINFGTLKVGIKRVILT